MNIVQRFRRFAASSQSGFLPLMLAAVAVASLLGCAALGSVGTLLSALLPVAAVTLLLLLGRCGSGSSPEEQDVAVETDQRVPGDLATQDAAADVAQDLAVPDSVTPGDTTLDQSPPNDTVKPDLTADTADVAPETISPTDDADKDGVPNGTDNCPLVPNENQADADGNGYGDACEAMIISPCCSPDVCLLDSDGDGIPDATDMCPWTASAEGMDANTDSDGDGIGDACDTTTDADGDGVSDAQDNCPRAHNPDQKNSDAGSGPDECDTLGDACDLCDGPECLTPCGEYCCYDADGDGKLGGVTVSGPQTCPTPTGGDDNCPWIANADQKDSDLDGVGDACDNCPDTLNPNQWDVNGDGVGDACTPAVTAQAGVASTALSALGAGSASDPRDLASHRKDLLVDLAAQRRISVQAFLISWPGEKAEARSALAGALRRHFVDSGVLPHDAV